MAVMASDGPSPNSPCLRLGLPAPQPSRRHHAQSLLGPSFHDQPFWEKSGKQWAFQLCSSLAEPPEASAVGNFFLEAASASEIDFA